MTEQGRILVIGATGNVGGQVVSQLAGTGAVVRAVVRDPDHAGLPAGVEAVRGDLSKTDTLEAALEGRAGRTRVCSRSSTFRSTKPTGLKFRVLLTEGRAKRLELTKPWRG